MYQKEKRLRQVSKLLIMGYNQSEIAEIIGKPTRTIVRDIAELKKQGEDWFENMPKNGYTYEVKLFSDFLKLLTKDMYEMYKNSQDIKEKLKIVDGLSKLVSARFGMMLKGPALHRIKNIYNGDFIANMNNATRSDRYTLKG